jgi:[ribosomal protein S5]-alanine N-acetyltransferase
MLTLKTKRLTLLALDAILARLQAEDIGAFLAHLGVAPLGNWPPEPFDDEVAFWSRDGLKQDPQAAGWYGWLLLEDVGEATPPRLIGAAALIGRPDLDGEVELGFGVLVAHQGRGFASETVAALSAWAFDNGAARVVAHVAEGHESGERALRSNGFNQELEMPYPGVALFARDAGAAS